MKIDKNLFPYLVIDRQTIKEALNKINENQQGLILCVNDDGLLLGVLTDGDFRRWVLQSVDGDLSRPIGSIVNQKYRTALITDDLETIRMQLSTEIAFLPLINHQGKLVALAKSDNGQFHISGRKIGEAFPCFVIAEIGNNHNGSIELAYRLVDEAINAGADCAKFQMRDIESLYANKGDSSDPSEDLGSQYTLDLLSRFQLSNKDMFLVFDYCHKRGIEPLCTPWDLKSLRALESYGMGGYKVASADFNNHDFLLELVKTGKSLICSTGMTVDSDIKETIGLLQESGGHYALLHCNSTYPAPFKDLNLSYMNILRTLGACPVGYSSHDRGINVAIAATALGANIIEKHFTLDRAMEGNDHRVSLLPNEFSSMVEGIRQVELSIGGDVIRKLSQGEIMNRESLGKSLWINTELFPGEVIEERMMDIRSPGRGLQPNRKKDLVGKSAVRHLHPGDILYPSDLGGEIYTPRAYKFGRPFGVPIRYHDYKKISNLSNFDLLEFHLSYQDLNQEIDSYISHPIDMDFVVHAPELFEHDHILDLCAVDDKYRNLSIDHMKRVVEVTLRLHEKFKRSDRPKIVINAGGFSLDKALPINQREYFYEVVDQSIQKIGLNGVELIPQTMPPFPWHFGGQRFHNLFVEADEIVNFCKNYNYRICLDVSHSKLACNNGNLSFIEFVEEVGPYTAHLHIADASGVDGEGLQIGHGDIDFFSMAKVLKVVAPKASFIPEIWQGHKNNGEGFWIALERLEKYF